MCSEDGIEYSPAAGGFTNPGQSAISQWGWGFHTVQGGVDMEDHRFCLRFVGVVRTEGFLIWGWDLNIPRWC